MGGIFIDHFDAGTSLAALWAHFPHLRPDNLTMDDAIKSVVIVHFDEDGELDYHVCGKDVRLFIVDGRAPHDRVYEWT